ncbi:MAG: DUF4149 domain-containing protein [Candidatus Sumerlaeaceae bacterium]
MLARSQRILAGIELFALALWVGGLFFLLWFASPVVAMVFPDDKDTTWRMMNAFYARFGPLEAIFGVVVLVSNFLKLVVFRGLNEMQRIAVMISAVMLTIAVFSAFQIRPLLDEKRAAFPSLNQPAPSTTEEIAAFQKMRTRYEVFLKGNLLLGLFMLYAYRSFEERKLQAITKILKAP